MKKGFIAVVAALAVCLAAALGPAVPAHAAEACTTHGAYALALAQVLGFDVSTYEAAKSALTGIGVQPVGAWADDPGACLSPEDFAAIRQSLADAGTDSPLPPGIGIGADAADRAAAALNDPDRRTPVSPTR